jgi:formylglycine-generating enzyme required for sulfatase activity/tRNA A-37 threonylcarbamoyl transferase component Bud32
MNPGETLSHYRIVALVGAGGMGEVYKAEDTRLKRPVALKVLTPALSDNPDAKKRLMVEAQAVSALDHPNICTIHEIDETPDGRVFLAMAYYEGETLSKRIARGTVPLPDALDIVIQLARAVATAHDAGIIHRDIKPANIFLCSRTSARARDETRSDTSTTARHLADAGAVKLLDFGIAKLKDQTGLTRTGTTVGTAAYMSPEHIGGHAIDERADVWSLGVVLYELTAGVRPFNGENSLAIMRSIAETRPPAVSTVRSEVPPALESIIERALQKRPGDRYESAHHLLEELQSLRVSIDGSATATMARPVSASRTSLSKRALAIGAVAIVVLAAASLWLAARSTRARRTQASVDEIRTMVEHDQFYEALRRLRSLPPDVASDRAVEKLRQEFFMPLSIRTDPPDADVYVKGYEEPKADWLHLGRTPIDTRGAPGAYRWRVVKAGYETFEGASGPSAVGDVVFALAPNGTTPEDEVRAPGGELPANGGRIPDFRIDRFEVTNKQFKKFVDAGGYREPAHWQYPFVKERRTLTWEQAVAEFRDTTGRPGPSTWELGTYPNGQDDWPVSGISWYEAAAYAHFAGRSLPTVHHWQLAAQMSIYSQILEWSNFSGKGPARVGEFLGIGPFGTYDMAGNVKEWCLNEVGDRRYIMGGGWNEPNYQYRSPDARLPFDRSSNNGMRLVTITDPSAVPTAAYAPVPQLTRDYARE